MTNLAKNILFILLLQLVTIGANGVYAQQFGSNVMKQPLKQQDSSQKIQGFKPDVRLSLGTTFTNFGPGFNTLGTFVAPEISLPVNKRFSVQVGLGYSSLFFNQDGETMFANNPSQYGSLYVSGTYQVNEKLWIKGTGYKTFLLNPSPPGDQDSPGTTDFSNQGVILDIGYKVSEHFHINASFEIRQQNYPSYNFGTPQRGFGTPVYGNPAFGGYGRSPFGF